MRVRAATDVTSTSSDSGFESCSGSNKERLEQLELTESAYFHNLRAIRALEKQQAQLTQRLKRLEVHNDYLSRRCKNQAAHLHQLFLARTQQQEQVAEVEQEIVAIYNADLRALRLQLQEIRLEQRGDHLRVQPMQERAWEGTSAAAERGLASSSADLFSGIEDHVDLLPIGEGAAQSRPGHRNLGDPLDMDGGLGLGEADDEEAEIGEVDGLDGTMGGVALPDVFVESYPSFLPATSSSEPWWSRKQIPPQRVVGPSRADLLIRKRSRKSAPRVRTTARALPHTSDKPLHTCCRLSHFAEKHRELNVEIFSIVGTVMVGLVCLGVAHLLCAIMDHAQTFVYVVEVDQHRSGPSLMVDPQPKVPLRTSAFASLLLVLMTIAEVGVLAVISRVQVARERRSDRAVGTNFRRR